MTRLDVTPADLVRLADRLGGLADSLDARRAGADVQIAGLAPGLGGDLAPQVVLTGQEATDAARRLVDAYRGLATLLSDSAGRYVLTDDGPRTGLQRKQDGPDG